MAKASDRIFLESEKKDTWRKVLAGINAPNKIQPQEYSKGSGFDDILRKMAESERQS